MIRFFFCVFTIIVSGILSAQSLMGFDESPRTKLSINQDWKFKLGDPEGAYWISDFDDSNWASVHLPHTLELASLNLNGHDNTKKQETFHREVGWYRRDITVDDINKKTFIEFEGAHQVTDLWVNGKHVGQHSVGGYTPFHFDITSFIEPGKNQITVLVDNRIREDVPPDPGPFDYIKFGGLYRDVYQVTTERVRTTFNWEGFNNGVYFTTPSVDPVNLNATLDIKSHVINETQDETRVTLISRIIDENDMVVLALENEAMVDAGKGHLFAQIGALEDDVRLWSPDDPYLYRLNTSVYQNGILIDAVECKVGLRKFEQHPREGFLLNGQPIELIGANRHQHYGYIGDAMPNSLHRKDVEQFKQLGFNVIRTAHYPQDNALIEACDELGLLVYEEAPTWIAIGNKAWFNNLENAARTMVRNHRNHPSVVIWGAGINHRGYVPGMHLAVKQEDPTRLTASQSSRWTGWQTSGLTDIYGQMVYGPVAWNRHEPMLAMEGREGLKSVADNKRDPLLTGIIAWNAHDYYTFHPANGRWPQKVRPGGIMSIFRHPYGITPWFPAELKDQAYLHVDSQWTPETDEVVVYTNADRVDLVLNGEKIASKRPDQSGEWQALNSPPINFKSLKYAPGKLEVIGYVAGVESVRQTLFSMSEPAGLKLIVDDGNRQIEADGSDIIQVYAYVIDENGQVIKDAEQDIKLDLKGPATIIGEEEQIGSNPIKPYRGNAPFLIRANTTAGQINLTASSDGLKSAKASIQSIVSNPNIRVTRPFIDRQIAKVDLGAPDQLLQFDWVPWNDLDGTNNAIIQLNDLGGVDVSLSTSKEGVVRWLGEMNVMGKYGFTIGEGVLAIDPTGLKLKLEGLVPGDYVLRTYHHAPRSNTDSMDPNKERLKSIKIFDIAFSDVLDVHLKVNQETMSQKVRLTEGNMLPQTGPAKTEFKFHANESVEVVFQGVESEKGIWLNAFELIRLVK
jgi:beta-galactosidase